jgi:RHS repeat-associated protein
MYDSRCYHALLDYKFTAKERDAETGLDYFIARYYSSAQGRFTSPDEFTGGPIDTFGGLTFPPGPLPYAHVEYPQSLNKYNYTYNNPLRYTDPDGHDALWVVDKQTGQVILVIPVSYTGPGATPENVRNIVNQDNSLDTGGSPVKIQVLSTDKPVNGVLNEMDLSPGLDFKTYPIAGEGTNAVGGNKAHINSDAVQATGAAAHDTLHFAGITDKYQDVGKDDKGNRIITVKPGYDSSNIMVSRTGTNIKPEQLREAQKNKTTRQCTRDKEETVCK